MFATSHTSEHESEHKGNLMWQPRLQHIPAEHGNKAAVAPAELAAGNLLNLLLAIITLNSNIS